MTGKHETPGPKPETVHIEGDWEEAVKKALKKQPPKKPPPSGKAPSGSGKRTPPTN